MKPPRPKTMLLIEDDPGLAFTLTEVALSRGYEVRHCSTATEALSTALSFKPTLIFSDVHLAEGDGRKVLLSLRADPTLQDCQFVMMTGDWVGASRQESIEFAADDYLAKPFTLEEFAACIDERYRQANL